MEVEKKISNHQVEEPNYNKVWEKIEACHFEKEVRNHHNVFTKKKTLIVSILLLTFLVAFSFTTPSIAQKIVQVPYIGTLYSAFGDAGINKAIEGGDIEVESDNNNIVGLEDQHVNIIEAFIDSGKLYLTMMMEKSMFDEIDIYDTIHVYLGEREIFMKGASHDLLPDNEDYYVFYFEGHAPLTTNNESMITVNFGEGDQKFSTSKEFSQTDSDVYKIFESIELSDIIDVNFHYVSASPVSIELRFRAETSKENMDQYELTYTVHDEYGEQLKMIEEVREGSTPATIQYVQGHEGKETAYASFVNRFVPGEETSYIDLVFYLNGEPIEEFSIQLDENKLLE